jgi:hypothetical protein
MKCEKVIESFLKQDDSRYPAFLIRLHIAFCSRCREEIRALQKIFVEARTGYPFAIPRDMSGPVMRAIINSDLVYKKDISSVKWLFPGVIIFASIFLVSYSDSFIWLKGHFGGVLEVPLFIVLGLAITFYAALFIGTHLEMMGKFIEFINDKIHQ